ncbi:hypothetical protein TIFTF001_013621 [Ficus carica]|uniref:Uncharacterized protein n=1 Tax=Ficus carica TaxID=3494 RepID=A0AA88DIA7_FICCA|nr:hypothetical protein TIFTF001_013621 [Ficus carica]
MLKNSIHVYVEEFNPVVRTTLYGDHPATLITINGSDSFLFLLAFYVFLSPPRLDLFLQCTSQIHAHSEEIEAVLTAGDRSPVT